MFSNGLDRVLSREIRWHALVCAVGALAIACLAFFPGA
jgi:hypothetical protein